MQIHRTLRVGLTGGIACGKSTVARMFADLGCQVIDTDGIARELYRPGAPGHTALVAVYGDRILTREGEIDRPALAGIIFSDPVELDRVNGLIHPLVFAEEDRRIEAWEANGERIIVVESAVLIETDMCGRYDRLINDRLQAELQSSRLGIIGAHVRILTLKEVECGVKTVIGAEGTVLGLRYEITFLDGDSGHIDSLELVLGTHQTDRCIRWVPSNWMLGEMIGQVAIVHRGS